MNSGMTDSWKKGKETKLAQNSEVMLWALKDQ
jgi:hypothetical protein